MGCCVGAPLEKVCFLSQSVWVCVRVCVPVRVYMVVRTHVCICGCVHTCDGVCMCLYQRQHMHLCVCACAHMWPFMHVSSAGEACLPWGSWSWESGAPQTAAQHPLSRDELSLHPLSTGGVPQISYLMQGIWR